VPWLVAGTVLVSLPALWTPGVLAAVIVIGLGFQRGNRLLLGIGAFFLAVFLRVIQWFLASRAKCPLCMVPSLSNRGCAKNRNARKLFGSYRLRVAGTILLRNYFRCPYCGEPTVMELRQRKTHLIHSK